MTKHDGTKQELSRRFFEVLAQEAIMGIMAFDLNDRACVYSNALAREILESGDAGSHAGGPNLRVSDLFPQSVETRGHFRPFSDEILRREGLTEDVLIRKANGMSFIANVGVKYIDVGDEDRVLLLMFQDITFQKKLQRELTSKQEEIHKAYAELLEQNRQLKELDLAKNKFIALTTHELRTPLAAIVATAEVLVLELYESAEQKEEFIKTIHEQSLHLMELVNDVLDFAKIQAGKMDFFVEHADVRPVLKKIFDHFQHMADHARVSMSFEMPDESAQCYFDLIRLKEVANNVISNAIKYNKKSGGSVTLSITRVDGFTRVVVADTGQGIPPDKVDSVFNEFETVGNVSRHHKGTGLGMPISKRLIEAMGGRLTLESEVGVGTKFFIDLPNDKVLSEDMYRSRPDAWGDLAAE